MKLFSSIILTLVFLIIGIIPVTAQKVLKVQKAVYFDKTPPLKEMKLIEPGKRDRSWKDGVIRNEEKERERNNNPRPLPVGQDMIRQQEFGFRDGATIVSNFEGVPNLSMVYPPDTDGDVGPNHYFQMINLCFQIFDKEGNSLYGPADNRTLWSGFIGSWTGTNDGDPVVLYDHQADRWIASQFAINTPDGTYWELVAVSATGDPLGEWYRYAFQFPVFNDYPKLGIWPDGYYFAFNMFGEDYFRAAVCSLDRTAMLAGDPDARMILFDMPPDSEPASLLPASFDGPPPPEGTPDYFAYIMDDAYNSGDILSIWALKSDWTNPENSTFEETSRLNVEPFNSYFCNGGLGACIPQPDGGPNLEALSDRLMYRLQYRNFGTYQTMVTNHTVNADGNGLAGIRWYELRNLNDGNGWFIYQQGTYAPDQYHRWMGSIAMDGRGYIALGFSISNQTKYPSIHYTGRSPNDPLGQMTFYEEEIYAGTGIQTGSAARWGDYSMMSVDPVDDTTFWFTTEYVKQSGEVNWRTRIAGFTMLEDHVAPTNVTDLTAYSNTTNSITLNWTATGDNGTSGTAFLYDIRYSKDPITAENFEAATLVEKTPSPAESGTPESITVKNLEFSSNYYFAMKVRDRQFNYSGLSNVSQSATPGKPQITLEEPALVQKLFPGSVGTRLFTIQNNGASDLYYQVKKDTASVLKGARKLGDYADRNRVPLSGIEMESRIESGMESQILNQGRGAGNILDTYTGAAGAISGLAWVGNVLYMTDMEKNYLLRYDTALQKVTDTSVIHKQPFSMAWDGEYLWIGDYKGNFYAYNLDGTSAGFSFSGPTPSYSTLVWDGSHFLTNFIMEYNPMVWQVDETGQVTGSFHALLGNMKIWQLAYVKDHFYGHIWFTNNNGKIGQIQVDVEGNGHIVQQFAAPFISSYALAHDNYDLWYGKIGGTLYRIDDGIDEINWLKIDQVAGTIPAAGLYELPLRFDACRTDCGNYLASIGILSNDPEQPEVSVPVELLVTGVSLGADTSFCGHLSIVLDAGEGFASYLWSDGSTGQTDLVDSTNYGIGTAHIWVDVTDLGGTVKRDSISINFLDCASIFEFSSGLTVKVFPNPNKGQFTIQAEGLKEKLKVSLSDLSGKIIREYEMTSPENERIEIGNYPKGEYLLRIGTKEGIKVQKVVVY
jgi:hypothetical protein